MCVIRKKEKNDATVYQLFLQCLMASFSWDQLYKEAKIFWALWRSSDASLMDNLPARGNSKETSQDPWKYAILALCG